MREFKCRPFYDIVVDLDDEKTYEHLPNDTRSLDDLMHQEIGRATVYMEHMYPQFYDQNNGYGCYSQKKRVHELISNFAKNRKENYENIMWYKEQIFLFQDEIENMC